MYYRGKGEDRGVAKGEKKSLCLLESPSRSKDFREWLGVSGSIILHVLVAHLCLTEDHTTTQSGDFVSWMEQSRQASLSGAPLPVLR